MEKRPVARKKKVGRPSTGKRPVLAVRVHEPLYERIKSAAEESNLSISEETEQRLEHSFNRSAEIERLFGSAEAFELMKIVGSAMNLTGNFVHVGRGAPYSSWVSDAAAYDEALKAATRVLEALRPQGDAARPAHVREGTGEKIAEAVLKKRLGDES